MSRLAAALAVAGAIVVSSGDARAEADPKRQIAVLEFRSDSSAMANVGRRCADVLSRRTSLGVKSQQDAAVQLGATLPAELAACAGEAACVAAIGNKLGVAEVVLVGVAEFGDVILTIQRIDVSGKKVLSRLAEAMPRQRAITEQEIEQYLRRVMPRADFVRYGVIRVETNVEGAQVLVDGKQRGTTPLRPLRLPAPATYRIHVTKPGYRDFRAAVAVPPDAEVQVAGSLNPRPGRAWYGRWWVLALAGTVTAGAVTTAVLLLRDEPTQVDVDGEFKTGLAIEF